MPKKDYIIVGRDVGEAKYNLVGDNIIPSEQNPGGTPLDVIYVGKLMGDMSERKGDDRVASAEEIKLIRLSMRVDSVPPGLLKDSEAEMILENTEIKVVFDTRTVGDCIHEDTNVRILPVPSDGTLKAGLEHLEIPPDDKPFQPPLSYPVDENLMLAYMLDEIVEKVIAVKEPEKLKEKSWDQIRAHIAGAIEAELTKKANEDTVKQIAAFHRAVGIYMTNLCR